MSIEQVPFALQAASYPAEITRRAVFSAYARTAANSPGIIAGGTLSASDCILSAPASGLSVNLSPGELIIGGNEGGSQGAVYARVTSTTNLSLAAANASLPRIDLICGTVNDAGYTAPSGGVTAGQWAPIVVTGTPTASASLANLLGVAALPASSLLLAYCLVPASASNIITADIANVATVAASQFLSNNSRRSLLLQATGVIPGSYTYSVGGQDFLLYPTSSIVASGGNTNGVIPLWEADVFSPQDFQVPGKTAYARVRATLSNGVAPGTNIQVGLYPLTAVTSGASTLAYTFGTVVTGSTTGTLGPGANSLNASESSQFALPGTTGVYALGVNLSGGSGTTAAGSLVSITAQLYYYNA